MAREVPLVRADTLPRDDALAGLELDYFVKQEKWIAMRQNRLDLFTREDRQFREFSLLVLAGESLSPEHVLPLLSGRFGRPYAYFERCESTQRELAVDAPEGAVAVAEEQTAGRGRLGRSWHAPPRTSVLVSVNLRPTVPSARLPELSVVGGEAVAAAIARETGLSPVVKFPNDVLIDGRKVAGILAEARDDRVVLGIGINVNLRPEELPKDVDTPATSLQIEHGAPVDRAKLLAAVLARLETAYDAWISEAGRGD